MSQVHRFLRCQSLRALAALSAILFATPALACDAEPDQFSMMLDGAHYNEAPGVKLNNDIYGAFVGWECGAWGVHVGGYRHSHDIDDHMVTTGTAPSAFASLDVLTGSNWSAGLFGGAAYYDDLGKSDEQGWKLIGGVQARYDVWSAQVMPAPPNAYFEGVWAAGLSFDLGPNRRAKHSTGGTEAHRWP
ncbi:MAG: hypothetical protein AAFU41_16200 [Pseudomonadota bacterium]